MSYRPYNRRPERRNTENPLVSIYYDTVRRCRNMKLPIYTPIKYRYDTVEFSGDGIFNGPAASTAPTAVHTTPEAAANPPATAAATVVPPAPAAVSVEVENMDSFDMARKMGMDHNDLVLVLNLASHVHSGGGVKHGARAQEEDLYRKSNYFEANDQNFYPLDITEVVYSPVVHIIKDSNYKLLQQPYPVACLAVAAIRNPPVMKSANGETYARNTDKIITQQKIDMIFKVAFKHGHQVLVLGALGCGAFHNPPEEVALMFKEALNKYARYFKKIGFAILSPAGNSNYTIFKNVIVGTQF